MTAFDRFRQTIAGCDFPALHHGKTNGRNQTHSHEVLVAQGFEQCD